MTFEYNAADPGGDYWQRAYEAAKARAERAEAALAARTEVVALEAALVDVLRPFIGRPPHDTVAWALELKDAVNKHKAVINKLDFTVSPQREKT